MNKLLFTIGMLFISSVSLVAQEMMNGIVKDGSGKPLSGVKVSKVGEFKITMSLMKTVCFHSC